MSREKPQEFTMPCLGRPIQLGMLYDCRSDQLVSSVMLWNQETIKQSLDSNPQKFSSFEIIANNSTESKLSKLGVDENLKLSFLAGLVDVSGAAAYLNDQTSSEKQVRINLRYQSTAWIDRLSIGKLGDLVNPDVFKETTATHFVSAVLYGADAIIVFDQEVSHDEIPHSHGFMKSMVEKLPTICTSGNSALDISDTDKRKVQKFQCKVYCDLPLPEIPSTFEGVVNLCKDLPTLLGESDSPQKVWLYPLSKLNSKVEPIMRKISVGLVAQTQDFMEATHELEMKTTDLMNSEVCTSFVAIKKQLSCFKRRIAEYKVDFASNLATLIPKIRGGVEEEDELNKLFTGKDASPFSHVCLLSWVEGKMSEVKVLENYLSYMEGFKFAFLPGDMDSVVSDPEYNLVISFTFTAAGQCDPYLEGMTAYLQPHATGQDVKNLPTSWYNNSKIISNMKARTRLFKSFAKANEQVKETKFVVTSSIDELSEEGAVIELYEDCNKEIFEPPSKPGKPSATSVTHSSIQVNWSKPKSGVENVQFYNVHYCELSCSPEQWKAEKTSGSKESITVTNLGPQKKYCFKVQAECKAGLSEVSEVSEPIQTDLVSVAPGKPIVSSKSHNSIQLQWSKAQYGEHNIDCYTISCHETKDSRSPEPHCKTVKTEEQSATVSNLVPQTAYCFKVHADFRTGKSLISDISDPIQTYPVPVPPGEPIASGVTHNSIQLEWSKPQCEGHNLEFYTIFYHELINQPELEDWKQIQTTNTHASVLISDLAAQTAYSFKVRAEFSGDINLVSETSAPLKTHLPPFPPGKPNVSCVTHDSVHLEWSKPQYKEENVDCYTIFYHEIKDPSNQEQTWKETDSVHKESVTVSSLAAERQYSFKVCAKFESGMDLTSNSSDPIQTYSVPVPPGKPIASNVTHNSVQLQWTEPQYGGQSVEFYTVLYCEIKDPPSDEQWKDVRVESTKQSVTVSPLAVNMIYSFKVHAHFEAGIICSEISDPVQTHPCLTPPGKPFKLSVTHSSIQIQWSEACCAGQNVEFYTVSYHEIKETPDTELWKELKTEGATECALLSGLAAQTQYLFKVSAKFKTGMFSDSKISDPIQTFSVPVPPDKPIASNVTHNSIQLEWSKPQYRGQSVERYTVIYCENKEPPDLQKWKKVTLDNTKQSVTIDNLASQMIYLFKVQAHFKAGVICSESSDPIQTQSPPVPPSKPTASTITHDSIQLNWCKAQCGRGNVEFYSVFYQEIRGPSGHWKEIKTSEECITVRDLTPRTDYSFQIRAFIAGIQIDSEISDPIQTYPFPVGPGKPTASIVTHNSIKLEWSKAQYGTQNVSYTVCYYEFGQMKEIKAFTSTVKVGNLIPQAEYQFMIKAEFTDGKNLNSDTSDPIKTCPPPMPPGKPTTPTVTHDQLELKWSMSHYGGEKAEFYTVFFLQLGHQPEQWIELRSGHVYKESLSVCGLLPNVKYCFKVYANFKAGVTLESEASNPIQTSPPPVPPGKPFASKVTHNDVHLKWSEAHCGEHKVEFYLVMYHDIKDRLPQEHWEKQIAHKTSIIISNLRAQTAYQFMVYAQFKTICLNLNSTCSDLIQTMPIPVPPGKPAVSEITYNSAQLTWSPAQYGGEKVEYTVFSSDLSTQQPNKGMKTCDTLVTVSGLTNDTEYSFKIHAEFDSITLDSDPSDPVLTNPHPMRPGRPIAIDTTYNSIQLEWSEAWYGKHKVEGYTIFFCEIENPHTQDLWIEKKTRNTSAIVSGLTPETKYHFKVNAEIKAACKHGVTLTSDLSDPIQTKPLPVDPGRPIARNVTHNSVQLEWSKAEYGEYKVDHYTVYFWKSSNTMPAQKVWEEKKTISTSVAVSGLSTETKYTFKVDAKFEGGKTLSSEFSEPIQTNPSPHSPGKPTVCNVTHNTVQVQWTTALYGTQKVESYQVFYRRIEASKEVEQWREITSTSTNVTVGNLLPQSNYIFKVYAKFKDTTIITIMVSEISDPIQTLSPPVPPGKPVASSHTHNNVQLRWEKAHHETQSFNYYTVFYRKNKSKKPGQWKEVEVIHNTLEELLLVHDLTPETEYSFKVHAVFSFDTLKSEISDSISTHPASVSPGRPSAFSVTHNTIDLQWPRPVYGAEYVKFYRVQYREMKGQWKERKTKLAVESITISGLGAKKEYCFKIHAEITPCSLTSITSEMSEPIKTKDRIALQMLSAHPTREGSLEVHKLLMVEQMSDEQNRIRKCFIGKHPPCLPSQQKVLLVVGATGAGKSTLINGMINYILKVEWKDNFRFKLITEKEQQTQAKSQTKWITAYTLPKMEGSPVPYTLTVIDTPGFGDTEGLERDKAITKQIKEFFSMSSPNGIDHIDGIGFVTQSALARLTPTQRYIFNAILAIFGKDVAGNIFMMVTFADGQTPPVMAAIKDAEFPCCNFYKFNNSALFASNDVEADDEDPEADNFDRMFWKMGTVSFKRFFAELYKAKPASLQLTREVLEERERLETTINGLHPQIRCGLAKLEEMRQEEEVLKQHEADITTNQGFTYGVDITKQCRIDLQGQGIHVTNCLRCNYTCHPDCMIPNDEDKHRCAAMDPNGFCTVCTKKCKWDQHVNNPYRYEEYVVHEVRTSDDLKKKYDQAVAGKSKNESMMIGIDNQLKDVHTEVLTMIKQVQRCLHRLDEIALKPNPLTEVDFLDLLIESEKQQADPGWLHRVRYYESAKEQAVMLQHLQAEDVVADLDAEQDNPQYTSWYARFKYWVGWS